MQFKLNPMQGSRPRRAVPFIIKNQKNNSYQLTKEAEQLLKTVDKNISVVSVAGLYRTGKSYLLNSVILDKKAIFGVGPTVNPCTKGLWLYVEPDPTSEKRSMLVIDTEGLGALDEEANHDMKIFCLAVLLSTTFIYNSVGSIDENALQTLSLVLNLVNSIDQESNSCRPQFIWVVRDFTLQLIDDKGKTLSPQQYLEMALASNTKQPQKATIRKTITNAFTRRDCYTLVKPVIDQTKLQNLDHTPVDDLRPQFVSQSIELRNKIKSTLRQFRLTSTSNNITGREYLTVVQKYLSAINSGAVPNMIDTWAFIKEQKSREAFQQIRKIYSEKIKAKIITRLPMRRAVLEQQFRQLREQIRQLYFKMTYEESSCELVDQFVNNMLGQVGRLNSEQGRQQIKQVLTKEYQPYLKKLHSQYYNNYEQFEADINKNFTSAVVEKYSDRFDQIGDFVQKFAAAKLIDNFKFFQKKLTEQIKNLKSVKVELQAALTKQLNELGEAKQKQRRNYQEKAFELEKRIRIYEAQREQMLDFGKAEKQMLETNMEFVKKKNEELIATSEQQAREINNLLGQLNQIKQKQYIEHKENQKEKALFNQKEEYMSSKVRELELKLAEFQGKFKTTATSYESEKKMLAKQSQEKAEYLQSENKRLNDKLIESEMKISKMLDQAREMSQEMQSLRQNNINDKKKLEIKMIEAESNKKISKIEHELKQQNNQLSLELIKCNQKYQQASKRLKMLQEQLKNHQNNSQKQIAIHVQQIQFKQAEINELKQRYDQLRKSHQNMLENMNDNSKSQENSLQLKIYELTSEYQKELKLMETQNQQRVKSLKNEISMLQRHKEEIALQHSLDKKSHEAKEKQWRETNNMLQSMVNKLEDKLQSSEKDHEDINKEKETFYTIRIKQLEQQLEQVKEKTAHEIAENTKKSEEAFAVLKQYSQIEKQQWEKRLADEKERADKRARLVKQDLEKKLAEEKASFEQEVGDLQNRVVQMQSTYNQRLQNMQYDHDIALQKLTNQYMEQKVYLSKELALTQQKLDITNANFEKELQSKTRHYETMLENMKIQMTQAFEQKTRKLVEEKEALEQKVDGLKKSNRQLEQSNLIIKNQADKEKAVFREKQKSLDRKIVEMQNRLQSELLTYNKTIQTINDRHMSEIRKLNQQIDKLNSNLATLQEEKDKLETEHENNISRLQAKLKALEETKNKNKQDYEDIVNKFQCAVTHFGNQKKKFMQEKEKTIEQSHEKTNQIARQFEETQRKIIKDNEDRIARLATENKSLKQRIMLIELQKSTSTITKKSYLDESEKQKMDKKYQKRIEQYKELYQKQKQKARKLKEENNRLREQFAPSHSNNNNSTITYYERPSFSEISNSRLYNNSNVGVSGNMNTEIKRKFTNTPLGVYKGDEYSGVRFNQGTTGYKNRE